MQREGRRTQAERNVSEEHRYTGWPDGCIRVLGEILNHRNGDGGSSTCLFIYSFSSILQLETFKLPRERYNYQCNNWTPKSVVKLVLN